MDILLMLFFSFAIAGKFRKAGKSGAAKYILGMIAVILVAEFAGLGITSATGSLAGLGGAMVVGIAAAVLIYRAAGKAVLAEGSAVAPVQMGIATNWPSMRAGAWLVAVGAVLAIPAGYALYMCMNPTIAHMDTWVYTVMVTLRIRSYVSFISIVLGLAMAALCVGLILLGAGHKENSRLGLATKLAAGGSGAMALYLFIFAAIYRSLVQTIRFGIVVSRIMIYYLPCILTILFLGLLGFALLELRSYLSGAGRVFTVAAAVVFGIVMVFLLACVIFIAKRHYLTPDVASAWFGAPVLGYLLCAVSMFCLIFGKKETGE